MAERWSSSGTLVRCHGAQLDIHAAVPLSFDCVQLPDTCDSYIPRGMSTSPATLCVSAASTREATERFLDVLREKQQQYLESIGEANAIVRGTGELDRVVASTTQLSRQFFDAQRAIVARTGHLEATMRSSGSDDLLDLEGWDAQAASRELGALLDGWWSALNSGAATAMDESRARTSLVRQVESIQARFDQEPAVEGAASRPNLPAAVHQLLDHAEAFDLRGLLSALAASLRPGGGVPAPAASRGAFPPPSSGTGARSSQIAEIEQSVQRDLVIREDLMAPRSAGQATGSTREHVLGRLERLEQDRRRFWSDGEFVAAGGSAVDSTWFPTHAVLSMVGATAALTAVMALVG